MWYVHVSAVVCSCIGGGMHMYRMWYVQVSEVLCSGIRGGMFMYQRWYVHVREVEFSGIRVGMFMYQAWYVQVSEVICSGIRCGTFRYQRGYVQVSQVVFSGIRVGMFMYQRWCVTNGDKYNVSEPKPRQNPEKIAKNQGLSADKTLKAGFVVLFAILPYIPSPEYGSYGRRPQTETNIMFQSQNPDKILKNSKKSGFIS